MRKRQAGRPLTTEGKDLVTLDVCIERAAAMTATGRAPWTRRTLRNKISRGEYRRFGTYHCPEVDWNEVKLDLHWRRKAG